MIFVESGDAVIHAELIGDPEDQPVLVFVNSLGTDFRIWDEVAAAFRRGLLPAALRQARPRPVRPRARRPSRSTGMSTTCWRSPIISGIERFGLVGLSIGGMIAQRLAVRAPERRRRAGALRHRAEDRRRRRPGTPHRRGRAGRPRVDRRRRDGALVHRRLSRGRAAAAARLAQHADPAAPPRAMRRPAPPSATPISRRDAGKIDVPTLVVVGDARLSTPPDLVRAMAERIPGAQFAVIAGRGHLPCIEQPDALAGPDRRPPRPRSPTMTDAPTRYEEGLAVRRAVLGTAHVDARHRPRSRLSTPISSASSPKAPGAASGRGRDFTRRERSIVTLALLAALGHHEELALHLRATVNTGATPEDVAEAMLHVAVYAGVPAANSAIRIAKPGLRRHGGRARRRDEGKCA